MENLEPASPELYNFTHLIVEAKSKYSPALKLYSKTHYVLDSVEGFSHISFNYNSFPPVRIKTKPLLFILKRKENFLLSENNLPVVDNIVKVPEEQEDEEEEEEEVDVLFEDEKSQELDVETATNTEDNDESNVEVVVKDLTEKKEKSGQSDFGDRPEIQQTDKENQGDDRLNQDYEIDKKVLEIIEEESEVVSSPKLVESKEVHLEHLDVKEPVSTIEEESVVDETKENKSDLDSSQNVKSNIKKIIKSFKTEQQQRSNLSERREKNKLEIEKKANVVGPQMRIKENAPLSSRTAGKSTKKYINKVEVEEKENDDEEQLPPEENVYEKEEETVKEDVKIREESSKSSDVKVEPVNESLVEKQPEEEGIVEKQDEAKQHLLVDQQKELNQFIQQQIMQQQTDKGVDRTKQEEQLILQQQLNQLQQLFQQQQLQLQKLLDEQKKQINSQMNVKQELHQKSHGRQSKNVPKSKPKEEPVPVNLELVAKEPELDPETLREIELEREAEKKKAKIRIKNIIQNLKMATMVLPENETAEVVGGKEQEDVETSPGGSFFTDDEDDET